MQQKNQPTYCVGCEDPDVIKFTQSYTKQEAEPFIQAIATPPPIVVKTETPIKHYVTSSGQYSDTIDALNLKIKWATQELLASSTARYNIELCDMIKAAVQTIDFLSEKKWSN